MAASLAHVREVLQQGPLPSLVVFDLDYTLWSCYIDCSGGPPFRVEKDVVRDGRHWGISLYDDVRPILSSLHQEGCKIGIASRTEEPRWAEEVIGLVKIYEDQSLLDMSHFREIYPGSKTKHFARFKKDSSIEYQDMLFFDDESRNIHEVSKLGVTSILCESGLDASTFVRGIKEFRRKHSSSSSQQCT